MKNIVIHEKFEVRKSAWETVKKLVTEKNFNWNIDVKKWIVVRKMAWNLEVRKCQKKLLLKKKF